MADWKDALSEDRQQQEDAAGQTPSRFDADQRGDVGLAAHIPQAVDQVRDAGQIRRPLAQAQWRRRCERRHSKGHRRCCVVSGARNAERRAKERRRIGHECDVSPKRRRDDAAHRGADGQHGGPCGGRQRIGWK